MGTAKRSAQRRQASRSLTQNGLGGNLPTSVQKSYFMLSDAEREILSIALEKYRPGQKPAHIGLRSQYALRFYDWAKKHVSAGSKRISLDRLRTVLGLDSVTDVEGNVIREGRLAAWANFRHRALNVALAEINAKTDLNIALKSLERAAHGRVATLIFAIRSQVGHTLIQKGRLRVKYRTRSAADL